MRVRKRLERLSGPSAVAIGNFDGFHAGHRSLVETLARIARDERLSAVILSFHPHPRVFFGQPIRLISTDVQRLEALKHQKPDHLFFIDFATVADRPAAEFVRAVLIDILRLKALVVGEDFRFGRGREGDMDSLAHLADAEGFALERVPGVEIDGSRVTSSRIRTLLEAGAVNEARRFLEKPYFIDGIVERGAGRGRELGFPTMNLASENAILPSGVFHTEVEFCGSPVPWNRGVGSHKVPPAVDAGRCGRRLPSATFIGRAPAFTDPARPRRVETHVPGFQGQVYGKKARLHFIRKIREERKFSDAGTLVAQIRRDIASLGI